MAKKGVLALILAAFVVGGAFAQIEMSVGGGALLDFSGNNGVRYTGSAKDYEYYMGFRGASFGAFAFFDASYVEADVYFVYGTLTTVVKGKSDGVSIDETQDAGSVLSLGFSLLGKYPIDIGNFTFFPLLGISYNAVLSWKYEGESYDKPGDLSQFGLLAGVGGDIKLSGPLFIRLEGLLHLRFASKYMRDTIEGAEDVKTTLGFGPQIKAAIGYKF